MQDSNSGECEHSNASRELVAGPSRTGEARGEAESAPVRAIILPASNLTPYIFKVNFQAAKLIDIL